MTGVKLFPAAAAVFTGRMLTREEINTRAIVLKGRSSFKSFENLHTHPYPHLLYGLFLRFRGPR